MAPSRTIIIAGAGIGGLTAALVLAQRGFRVSLLDQAPRLEETGAGIQLSPNATHILAALGLTDRLKRDVVAPEALDIKTARGRALVRMPLGEGAQQRYGAPYWTIHRGDLQAALAEAARAHPDIELKLGTRAEDFIAHANGISVACKRGAENADQQGLALICADGLWSALRKRLGNQVVPQFRQRIAWRALIPADQVDPKWRSANVQLWLGRDAHLVHYPVRAGALINIVAIVGGDEAATSWSQIGDRDELLARFSRRWSGEARALLALPERWLKWALHDLAPVRVWGDGPVTSIGDAAHPMLPFLAQGAAMAIEDAAVLGVCFSDAPGDPIAAMRRYESARRRRTARVQRAARSNAARFHMSGAAGLLRNLALRAAGGNMMLRRYDWLYDWKVPSFSKE